MWQWILAWLVICGPMHANAAKCNRTPMAAHTPKTHGDNGYRIKVSGNPEKYVPGEVYTVSVQGWRTQYTVQKFIGFMLIVEPATSGQDLFGQQSVGTFQLYGDALTMHSDDCPNALTQTSSIPKSEIQVLWTAPPAGSGCVRFRTTIVEHRDVWFMDDGELTKDLCEEVQESDDMQPEVIFDCCACDEAKYEVTFEGIWSRHTHPKDYPTNEWLTHFSDIIGASHSSDYRVWEYGGYASDGLRQVAEWGSTRTLESELKRQSDHIRTIIKARGLWYPTVNGKTFAVFRVDNRHHLMSLVSMLGPSPDWVVGVSALELCLKNCSWADQKVLNLYPWDAGTDSGVSYEAPNAPTIPREKIRRITNSFPNDQRSPFYDMSGVPMKPLAKLTVTRQRVYEKSCSDKGILDTDESNLDHSEDDDASRPECAVTEWAQFTACSVTCGKGLRSRSRAYLMPMKADMMKCRRQLEENEMCAASIPICEGGNQDFFGTRRDYEVESFDSSICKTTDWSPWSTCSVTCGKGVTMRSRRYLDRMGRKKCNKELVEKDVCMAAIVECDHSPSNEQVDPSCTVTQWTDWSPCSVTCGKGVRVRTRYFLVPSSEQSHCGVPTMEKQACEGDRRDCTIDPSEAKEVCLQEMEVGPCRGYFPRWYYNATKGMCLQFGYGGCRGNRNNFESYDECTRMCEFARGANLFGPNTNEEHHNNRKQHSDRQHTTTYNSRNLEPSENQEHSRNHGQSRNLDTSRNLDYSRHQGNQRNLDQSRNNDYSRNQDQFRNNDYSRNPVDSTDGPRVDCMVTEWGEWSECTTSCGIGRQEQVRTVKVEQQNGGRKCPKKLVRSRKCKNPKCNSNGYGGLESYSQVKESYQGSYSSPSLIQPPPIHNYARGSDSISTLNNGRPQSYSHVTEEEEDYDHEDELYEDDDEEASTRPPVQDYYVYADGGAKVDCIMGEWSPWSPCTHSCGTEALQQRSRSVLTRARNGGSPCGPRLERRFCSLPVCPWPKAPGDDFYSFRGPSNSEEI